MLTRNILEADLLNHCMLRCAHCAVASPYLKPSYYPLEQFEKDVHALAGVIHLGQFRMIGGEPLMVKNLAEYVKIARASGLTDWVSMTTNGVLLEKADPDLLTSFDLIVVSLYHGTGHDESLLHGMHKLMRLEKKGDLKHVVICDTADFRFAELDTRIEDNELVQRIWRECTQKELCSCVRSGFVYRCTAGSRKGMYLKAIGQKDCDHLMDPETDGCAIHQPNLEDRLRVYFERNEPHEMCYYCLGNSSIPVEHRQLSREEIKNRQPTHCDPLPLLKQSCSETKNYSGETKPGCSKCKMGVLHEECDNVEAC